MGKGQSKLQLPYLNFRQKRKHRQFGNSFSSIVSTAFSEASQSSHDLATLNSFSLNDEDLFDYIDDRKFYKWGEYLNYCYPVDHDETDRNSTQHFMYKHVWNGNFASPIEKDLRSDSTKVLDVGCGSGPWVLDMASEYTNAQFVGVDIAKLYPSEIKPQNVSFVQANVILGLPFPDNHFDFVHMRAMLFAFTVKNWEFVISEMVRVCKPGGYVEIAEKDIIWYNEGPFCKAARTAMADELRQQKNIEVIITPILKKILSQYSDVNHDEKVIPFGEWGGKLGKIYRELYSWGAKNLNRVMTEVGFSEGEWNETVDICLKQLQERKAYDKVYKFWIQKSKGEN